MIKLISLSFFLSVSFLTHAQDSRINDYNNINWLQSINTVSLAKKWSIHLEAQWRRTNGFRNWQQGLVRAGVNYQLNDQVTLHTGYALAETFSYGDYPIAANGVFPEHRIYEQVMLRQPVKKWLLTHRFRIEQRWIGRVEPGTAGHRKLEGWTFLHRFRYQARMQYPLWQKNERQVYTAAADELLIGAGKKLGVNIFDQNRIFLLMGFRFGKTVSVEAGYVNQTLQQGKRVNGNTIMQRNNGLVITSFLQL